MKARIAVWACSGFLLFVFLTFVSDQAAHAEACAKPVEKPVVKIKTETGPIDYNTGMGLRELTQQARAENVPMASEAAYSMGLTNISWGSGAQLRLYGRPIGDSYCWSVESIDMTLKQVILVYIAREIVRESCAWREVRAHELKHVDLDKKMFLKLPQVVSAKVQAAILDAVMFKDGKAATTYFQKKGQAAMERALRDFSDKRLKQQRGTIDTKEEYARVDAACKKSEWETIFKPAGIK